MKPPDGTTMRVGDLTVYVGAIRGNAMLLLRSNGIHASRVLHVEPDCILYRLANGAIKTAFLVVDEHGKPTVTSVADGFPAFAETA